MDVGDEGGGRFAQVLARLEERPADEQHHVGSIEIKHFTHASGGHAARGHGELARRGGRA